MDPHAYVMALTAGSALIGLWLSVRFERIAPKSGKSAALCFVAAWLISGLAGPLTVRALVYLPAGPALLVSVLPVLAVTFALIAWVLRYFVGLLGHAAR